MVSVAFVDDHPMLLEGVQSIFRRRAGFTVVAVGACCGDAVRIARDAEPDVIVLDLNMDDDPYACIKVIKANSPNTKVIAFTASAAVSHAIQALEAGASGYVLKGGPLTSLAEAVETVVHGEIYITQGFAAKLLAAMKQSKSGDDLKLSQREDQIVRLVLEGKTNKQIGIALNITEKTVKYYMTIIMNKLKVKNRVGVALVARGLMSSDAPVANNRASFN